MSPPLGVTDVLEALEERDAKIAALERHVKQLLRRDAMRNYEEERIRVMNCKLNAAIREMVRVGRHALKACAL